MSAALLSALAARLRAERAGLDALDAAAGDGDHGTTVLTGIEAAAAAPDGTAPDRAFRMAAGGASGPLFAALLGALLRAGAGEAPLGTALSDAAARIAALGGAAPGDRTMLDALLPAAEAACAAPENAARAAAGAAARAAEATREMPARRGRARHVEGAGRGHVDAGARSVALLLEVYAEHAGEGR